MQLFIYIDVGGLIGFWVGYAGYLEMKDKICGGINEFYIVDVG